LGKYGEVLRVIKQYNVRYKTEWRSLCAFDNGHSVLYSDVEGDIGVFLSSYNDLKDLRGDFRRMGISHSGTTLISGIDLGPHGEDDGVLIVT
jgi:hypothetical protein